VLKNRIMVGVAVASAALIPIGGAAVLSASPAAAKTPPGIKCTKLTGKVTNADAAVISFSGCTGATGKTGTTSGKEGAVTSTDKWKSGKKTVFDNLNEVTGSTSQPLSFTCPGSDTAILETATVKSDTTKDTAPGAAMTADLCLAPSGTTSYIGTISEAPGTKYTIAG
jgi:hypothetical protein